MSRIESGRIELNREVFDFRDFVETLSNMILPQTEAKQQEYTLNCPERWYDVVLMDIRMPRLDGLQATERIRAMDREDAVSVPVIAMTANAFDADRKAAAKAGITGVFD